MSRRNVDSLDKIIVHGQVDGHRKRVHRSYDGQVESRSPLGYLSLQPIVLHKIGIAGTTSSKESVMPLRTTTTNRKVMDQLLLPSLAAPASNFLGKRRGARKIVGEKR